MLTAHTGNIFEQSLGLSFLKNYSGAEEEEDTKDKPLSPAKQSLTHNEKGEDEQNTVYNETYEEKQNINSNEKIEGKQEENMHETLNDEKNESKEDSHHKYENDAINETGVCDPEEKGPVATSDLRDKTDDREISKSSKSKKRKKSDKDKKASKKKKSKGSKKKKSKKSKKCAEDEAHKDRTSPALPEQKREEKLPVSPEINKNKLAKPSASPERSIHQEKQSKSSKDITLSPSLTRSKDKTKQSASPERNKHKDKRSPSPQRRDKRLRLTVSPEQGTHQLDKDLTEKVCETPQRRRTLSETKAERSKSPMKQTPNVSKVSSGIRSDERTGNKRSRDRDNQERSNSKSRRRPKRTKIKCVAETEFGTPNTDDYYSNWESDPSLAGDFAIESKDHSPKVENNTSSEIKPKESRSPSEKAKPAKEKENKETRVSLKNERKARTPPKVSLAINTRGTRIKSPSPFRTKKSPRSPTRRRRRSPSPFRPERSPWRRFEKSRSSSRMERSPSSLKHTSTPAYLEAQRSPPPFRTKSHQSPPPLRIERPPRISRFDKSPPSFRTENVSPTLKLQRSPSSFKMDRSSPTRIEQSISFRIEKSLPTLRAGKSPSTSKTGTSSPTLRAKKSPLSCRIERSLQNLRVEKSPPPRAGKVSPTLKIAKLPSLGTGKHHCGESEKSPFSLRIAKSPTPTKLERTPSPIVIENSASPFKIEKSPSFKIEKSPQHLSTDSLLSSQLLEIPLNIKSIKCNIMTTNDADTFDIFPANSTPRRSRGEHRIFTHYSEDSWERDDFESSREKPEIDEVLQDKQVSKPKELENEYEKFMQAVSFDSTDIDLKKVATRKKKRRYSTSSSSSSSYDSDSSTDSTSSTSSTSSSDSGLHHGGTKKVKKSSKLRKKALPAPVPPPGEKSDGDEFSSQKEEVFKNNAEAQQFVNQNSLVPTVLLPAVRTEPITHTPVKQPEMLNSFVCISEGIKEKPKVAEKEQEVKQIQLHKEEAVKPTPRETKQTSIDEKPVRQDNDHRRNASESVVPRRSHSRSPLNRPRDRSKRSNSPGFRRRGSRSPRKQRHRDYSPSFRDLSPRRRGRCYSPKRSRRDESPRRRQYGRDRDRDMSPYSYANKRYV